MSKFALVKWLGEEDKGQYTAGVPTDWIRNFDAAEFKKEEYPEDMVFVVEWRSSKKPPPGGYELHDAIVVELSDSVRRLERKAVEMDLALSPTRKPQAKTEGEKQLRTSPRKSVSKSKASLFSSQESKSKKIVKGVGAAPTNQSVTPQKKSVQRSSAQSPLIRKRQKLDVDFKEKNVPECRSSSKELKSPVPEVKQDLGRYMSGVDMLDTQTLEEKGNICKECTEERPKVLASLNNISERLEKIEKLLSAPRPAPEAPASPHMPSTSTQSFSFSETGKTVNLKKACPVSDECWDTASKCATPTAMVATLLIGAFDLTTLLKSSYKGGKTKVGPNKGQECSALDSAILKSLLKAVQTKFPAFQSTQFGMAVNNKLTALKLKHKKMQEKVTEDKKTPDLSVNKKKEDLTENLEGSDEERPSPSSPLKEDLSGSDGEEEADELLKSGSETE